MSKPTDGEVVLRGCPFCSQRPYSGSVPADDGVGADWWRISCGDCEVKIERPSLEMASRDWNSRASSPAVSALAIPTDENTVAWAEECDRIANALIDILNVIEADDLIPESVSYMRAARNAVKHYQISDGELQRIKTNALAAIAAVEGE